MALSDLLSPDEKKRAFDAEDRLAFSDEAQGAGASLAQADLAALTGAQSAAANAQGNMTLSGLDTSHSRNNDSQTNSAASNDGAIATTGFAPQALDAAQTPQADTARTSTAADRDTIPLHAGAENTVHDQSPLFRASQSPSIAVPTTSGSAVAPTEQNSPPEQVAEPAPADNPDTSTGDSALPNPGNSQPQSTVGTSPDVSLTPPPVASEGAQPEQSAPMASGDDAPATDTGSPPQADDASQAAPPTDPAGDPDTAPSIALNLPDPVAEEAEGGDVAPSGPEASDPLTQETGDIVDETPPSEDTGDDTNDATESDTPPAEEDAADDDEGQVEGGDNTDTGDEDGDDEGGGDEDGGGENSGGEDHPPTPDAPNPDTDPLLTVGVSEDGLNVDLNLDEPDGLLDVSVDEVPDVSTVIESVADVVPVPSLDSVLDLTPGETEGHAPLLDVDVGPDTLSADLNLDDPDGLLNVDVDAPVPPPAIQPDEGLSAAIDVAGDEVGADITLTLPDPLDMVQAGFDAVPKLDPHPDDARPGALVDGTISLDAGGPDSLLNAEIEAPLLSVDDPGEGETVPLLELGSDQGGVTIAVNLDDPDGLLDVQVDEAPGLSLDDGGSDAPVLHVESDQSVLSVQASPSIPDSALDPAPSAPIGASDTELSVGLNLDEPESLLDENINLSLGANGSETDQDTAPVADVGSNEGSVDIALTLDDPDSELNHQINAARDGDLDVLNDNQPGEDGDTAPLLNSETAQADVSVTVDLDAPDSLPDVDIGASATPNPADGAVEISVLRDDPGTLVEAQIEDVQDVSPPLQAGETDQGEAEIVIDVDLSDGEPDADAEPSNHGDALAVVDISTDAGHVNIDITPDDPDDVLNSDVAAVLAHGEPVEENGEESSPNPLVDMEIDQGGATVDVNLDHPDTLLEAEVTAPDALAAPDLTDPGAIIGGDNESPDIPADGQEQAALINADVDATGIEAALNLDDPNSLLDVSVAAPLSPPGPADEADIDLDDPNDQQVAGALNETETVLEAQAETPEVPAQIEPQEDGAPLVSVATDQDGANVMIDPEEPDSLLESDVDGAPSLTDPALGSQGAPEPETSDPLLKVASDEVETDIAVTLDDPNLLADADIGDDALIDLSAVLPAPEDLSPAESNGCEVNDPVGGALEAVSPDLIAAPVADDQSPVEDILALESAEGEDLPPPEEAMGDADSSGLGLSLDISFSPGLGL